ncbi:ammecr1 family protein [Grosmannia clavigera kw1407]|uniref:Ammecr1 family protein n=1 Tax=Grosmannia clavigera (strain kw1407 / UAMH 11150) TaxID=655863 RepID=F0XEJ1_GROCL|nr:ammecr1 family protein [Grosmannia clavigera kw1407]EFX04682.1 ammecr1 family protein [Grosmannia clavigera kw1407]
MATTAHCLFCFETLAARLEGREALDLVDIERSYAVYDGKKSSSSIPSPSSPSSPLFVTWNTTEGFDGAADRPADDEASHELRGCIGTFAAEPLVTGLATYALTAALKDHRFQPVSRRELPLLRVAVTLLTDFEPAADADDWQLGRHGLRIAFVDGGRRYGATYLPDVAPEQGWSKEQTVVSLMRKAGWSGRTDRWRDGIPEVA